MPVSLENNLNICGKKYYRILAWRNIRNPVFRMWWYRYTNIISSNHDDDDDDDHGCHQLTVHKSPWNSTFSTNIFGVKVFNVICIK